MELNKLIYTDKLSFIKPDQQFHLPVRTFLKNPTPLAA